MKRIFLFLVVASLFLSCKTDKKIDRKIVIGDTITTNSGLQYIFLKEGNGRKIEKGSKVKVYTDLYVNNSETVLWTTAGDKDSIFTFIHGKTSLITGFKELHKYLFEGDEVIAIIPASLAYGQKGSGTSVPPNATLIYKPLKVKYVSEPKEVVADTLVAILKNKDVNEALNYYNLAVNNKTKQKYHTDLVDNMGLFIEATNDSLYKELEVLSNHFLKKDNDENMTQSLNFYKAMSLHRQGKIKEAIEVVEPLSKKELNKLYWVKTLEDLKKEL